MRTTRILRPSPATLITGTVVEDGPRQFISEDAPYRIRLNREGEVFNRNSPYISVEFDGQTPPPGYHHESRIPPPGGYMPQSFSKPYRVRFGVGANPTDEDVYGKTALNVRRFNNFRFVSLSGTHNGKNFLKGGRLFSYNDGLFFLTETFVWSNDQYYRMARLFRYSEESDAFDEIKTFSTIPIDSNENQNQYGSPDYYIWDSKLHVVYRTINRDDDRSYIVVFRANEGLTEWSQISSTPITDAWSVDLTRFRLRVASSKHSVMVVVYLVTNGLRNGVTEISKADMRSYISYDGGYVLNTKNKSYRNVRYNDGSEIERVTGTNNMAYLFLPNAIDTPTSNISPMNEKFGLYYDENMGEYVILKAGDPSTGDPDRYLMGIKTVENDLHNWESCLKLRLDDRITCIPPEYGTPWNPYNESTDHNINDFKLLDLDIAPGPTINTMIVHTKLMDEYYDYDYVATPEFTFLVEFTFASESDVPKFSQPRTSSLYAYGGKFHPEYSFICSPWNPIPTGLATAGMIKQGWNTDYPMICNWRNQVVASNRTKLGVNQSTGYDENVYSCLHIFSTWQNYEEKYGYEFALSARQFNINTSVYGMSPSTLDGAFTYTPYEKLITTVFAPSGYCFLSVDGGNIVEPSLMEKASLSKPEFFKTRITVKINGLTASGTKTVTFLKAGATADGIDGYSFVLIAKDNGTLEIKTIAGTSLGVITSFDWDQIHEFVVGVCYNRDHAITVWMLHRENPSISEVKLNIVGQWNVSRETLAAPIYNIGTVASANVSSGGATIYDVQISCFGHGFRSLRNRKKAPYELVIDGGGLYSSSPSSYEDYKVSPNARLFDSVVELWDGSKIEILGESENTSRLWSYANTRSGNSSGNVYNGVLNSVYDFSLDYIPSLTTPHCHCYIEDFNTAEGNDTEGCHLIYEIDGPIEIYDIAMFNVHGIHCYDVIRGSYNPITRVWTDSDIQHLNIPRINLDFDPSITLSKTILMNSLMEDIQDGHLEHYSILIYNTVLKYYTGQLIVKNNTRISISVTTEIPSLDDCELHLMFPYLTEYIESANTETVPTHIGFRFYAEENALYKNIGEVIIGESIDISDSVNSVEVKSQGASDIDTSSFDFTYSPRSAAQPLASVATIQYINQKSIPKSIRNLVFNCITVPNVVLIHEQHDRVPLLGYGNFSSLSENEEYFNSGSTDFIFQDFLGVFRTAKFPAAPIVRIFTTSGTTGETGVTFLFTSTVVSESDTNTYDWDFGDGTTVSGTSVPTHAYADYGLYIVTLTVTDKWGQSSISSVTMNIQITEDYQLGIVTTAPPLAVGFAHDVTIQSLNLLGSVATWNNTTQVRITDLSGGLNLDFDSDGLYDEVPDDDPTVFYPMEDGIFTFKVASLAPASYLIQVEDQYGNFVQTTLTFA
jgi:PKD repeat protein